MDFQSVINIILPRRSDNNGYYRPEVTYSATGEKQGYYATRPGRIHGGVDINYYQIQPPFILDKALGQSSINLAHPVVGSPVSGVVSDTNPDWGMIEIRDTQEYRHQIWHLNKMDKSLKKDETYVYAGQYIGDMGGRGPNDLLTEDSHQYQQHVHYSILTQPDSVGSGDSGNFIDPKDFWDNNLYYVINAGSLNHLPLQPANQFDAATQELLNSLSPGLNILSNGETLRREGNQIWRIKSDGSTRGYFISE